MIGKIQVPGQPAKRLVKYYINKKKTVHSGLCTCNPRDGRKLKIDGSGPG
jgi:hypothetical protein